MDFPKGQEFTENVNHIVNQAYETEKIGCNLYYIRLFVAIISIEKIEFPHSIDDLII